jgi:hypothetical protein
MVSCCHVHRRQRLLQCQPWQQLVLLLLDSAWSWEAVLCTHYKPSAMLLPLVGIKPLVNALTVKLKHD